MIRVPYSKELSLPTMPIANGRGISCGGDRIFTLYLKIKFRL